MKAKGISLQECARIADGALVGDGSILICGVGDLNTATNTEITFVTKAAMYDKLALTHAAAVILPLNLAERNCSFPHILVKDPYLAITRIHQEFEKEDFIAGGISDSAVIGQQCQISEEVTIGAHVSLGNDVTLGQRVTLHAGVAIGDNVVIGDDCCIYSNVVIYNKCRLGNRVLVHAGTVIGSDGYGYATDEMGRHHKRPHVGTVVIEDDVEIGANVCIDRATFGQTVIRQGTKIDNLVQIAHNVEIGEHSLLVAQVGIAGSTKLGRNVVLGGNVGVAGHAVLGDRVMVAAKSGVHGSIEAGAVIAGYPAISREKWLRASALAGRLPDMHRELRKLRQEVDALRQQLKATEVEGKSKSPAPAKARQNDQKKQEHDI